MVPNLDDLNFEGKVPDFDPHKYVADAVIKLHLCCDGAMSEDDMGFAGMHTVYGKRLGKKLLNGYLFDQKDLRWCERALPYYMNTQLDYMDKELFKQAIEDLKPEAKQRYIRYSSAKKDFSNMDAEVLAKMLVGAQNFDKVPEEFKKQATNLQAWYREKNFFSRKQCNFAALIMRRTLENECYRKIYYPSINEALEESKCSNLN